MKDWGIIDKKNNRSITENNFIYRGTNNTFTLKNCVNQKRPQPNSKEFVILKIFFSKIRL